MIGYYRFGFPFEETDKLISYREQEGGYSGHMTGKTVLYIILNFELLDFFDKIHEIVREDFED
jgi:hypothetical protein